jgi:hypothetical protein
MTKEILKRLLFTFLISFAISMVYAWTNYQSTTGLEARQGMFILVLVNFGINILNFILSLTALLNLNENIRGNIWTSMLSFFVLPFGLLLLLIGLLVNSPAPNVRVKDFFVIGIPSTVFCLTLIYHFYRFRQTLNPTSKT